MSDTESCRREQLQGFQFGQGVFQIFGNDGRQLRARLAGRATEDDAAFELRMRNAEMEMRGWPDYRYCLVSDTRENDAYRFRAFIESERMRSSLRRPAAGG